MLDIRTENQLIYRMRKARYSEVDIQKELRKLKNEPEPKPAEVVTSMEPLGRMTDNPEPGSTDAQEKEDSTEEIDSDRSSDDGQEVAGGG